jgi:hypothetical protein
MEDTYNCKNCKEKWNFCAEDYQDPTFYPDICPLCNMPVTQMIRDCYMIGGIKEVLMQLRKRFLVSR